MLARGAGWLVAPVYQASFPELERLLLVLGELVAGLLIVFILYVPAMASRGWPGARIRTVVGILGGLLLLGLGLLIVFLALVLLAPAFYIMIIGVVWACLGIAAWLLWRHLRHP